MRGKKGLVRYMNNMKVQDSVKMVIYPCKATNEVYTSIPEYIARNTSVLRLEYDIWNPSTIKDVDYAII